MEDKAGIWQTRDKMGKFGFICEKKVRDFCIFDMVEFNSYCLDFRVNERTDLHNWEGANQVCSEFGMGMMQISGQTKDEFVNNYLWNLGLFTNESPYVGIWLGGKGINRFSVNNN